MSDLTIDFSEYLWSYPSIEGYTKLSDDIKILNGDCRCTEFVTKLPPLMMESALMFYKSYLWNSEDIDKSKEMESVFGGPPSACGMNSAAPQESHSHSPGSHKNEQSLSHVDSSGHARMVDITSKEDSKRVAVARCKVLLGQKTFNLVAANQIAKGDVLNVAKIAGINGAKQTSTLIPLCRNIGLTHVRVDLALNKDDFSVEVEGEAAATGKTGVEMEAMTAVAVAGLTIYDMCKAASKDIQITSIHLEHKTGGKSGNWSRTNYGF